MGTKKVQSGQSKTSSKNEDSAEKSKKTKVNGAKKGKAFERQIATALGGIFPDAERMLEFQASGNIGTDLQNTDVFQFQCKRYANYAPIGKINEIKIQSKEHYPVLITQGNRMECMAVLPFEKFVTLLEIAYGHAPRLINPYVKQGKDREVPASLLVPYSYSGECEPLSFEMIARAVARNTVDAEVVADKIVPLDSFL